MSDTILKVDVAEWVERVRADGFPASCRTSCFPENEQILLANPC